MTETLVKVKGWPLSDHMKDMGIVGVTLVDGEWRAEFAKYPGAQFLMPQPVMDWLVP